MKIRYLVLLLFISNSVLGQEKQSPPFLKFQYLVDYRYILGFFEGGSWGDINRGDSKMYANSLHLTALYNLNSKLALGAGMGLDRYERPGFTNLPVFLSCHYVPLDKISPAYIHSTFGYSLGIFDFVPGFLFDFGIGYKKMFRKHFGLNFQIGYNLKERKDNIPIEVSPDYYIKRKHDQYRHSVFMGIGLIF